MMGGILLYAFAGALLGGIDSPGGAVLGGFMVGVLENVRRRLSSGTELKLTVALVLIVGVLVVRPSGLFGKVHVTRVTMSAIEPHHARPTPHRRRGRRAARRACALPFVVSNYRVFQLTLVLVYAIALLGLNMLTGYNGQISLGHGAFYAIGAYAAAILMDKCGVPYWATHAGRRRGLPRRRLPVRPAGAAARGPVPRARDLRARRRDAADAQVQAPRALDRRRAGHRHHQARCARSGCRSTPGPVALLLHAGRGWS